MFDASTAIRPVTHTPATLRAETAHHAYWLESTAAEQQRVGGDLNRWFVEARELFATDPESPRFENNFQGVYVVNLIHELALVENDERDAYAENESHTPATSSIGILPEDEQDWSGIDREIHDEFPGPIQDQKLSKLRELALERQNLRRRVVELETRNATLSGPITDPRDPRMFPLLGQAADEADAQGYCSVYEQISGTVGFPTRDELRDMGHTTSAISGHVHVADYEYGMVEVRRRVTWAVDVSDINDTDDDDLTINAGRDEQYEQWELVDDFDNVSYDEMAGKEEITETCRDNS